MAPLQSKTNNSSSNRGGRFISASAYVVDRSTMLKGYHYSATGADGKLLLSSLLPTLLKYALTSSQGHSGIPEVATTGIPSPPSSPPLAALTSANEVSLIAKNKARKRELDGTTKGCKEGAAYAIREECERLFCETMKTVFLREKDSVDSGSYDLDAHAQQSPPRGAGDVQDNMDYFHEDPKSSVTKWLELWDYAGGNSFRGFVAGTGDEKCLFAFFDPATVSNDLKPALIAIIELASETLQCAQVVVCLDRSVDDEDRQSLLKSLEWIGFELITLDMWMKPGPEVSDKWLLMGMEL